MDTIVKQVRRAHIRLVLEQFVQRLFWCAFLALGVATVAIALPKLFVISTLPEGWGWMCLTAAGCVAFLAAIVWTYMRRRTELESAVELDIRYDLRERVASSMYLDEETLNTRAGKALVEDAIRRVERIDVTEHFRIRPGRRPWLPLIPAIIAFCLLAFVNDRSQPTQANAGSTVAIQKQVKKSADKLQKRAEKKKKEAAAKGLKEAEALFKDVDKGMKDLSKKQNKDRKKAVVKLNDLAQQMEQRRNKLGGGNRMKEQFNKLKKLGKGPAEKLAEAMKQGDMKKAIEELKKLKKKISKGELSKKDKKKLQKQLNQMKKKLQDAVDANKQKKEELKKKIEEQKKKGNTEEASKLQEKLNKMNQKQPQMDQLNKLAEKLGQAQQKMQNGDKAGAQEAMEQLAQQMEDMQMEMEEMKMLDDMLQELDEAKNNMGCKQCQGGGCQACEGGGEGEGKKKGGWGGKKPGKGGGTAKDEENATGFRDTKVKQKTTKGRAVITGTADGANRKGQTKEGIKDAVEAGAQDESDPLAGERLPRSRREQAEEYFNAVREDE